MHEAARAAEKAETAAGEAEAAARDALVNSRALEVSATPVAITDTNMRFINQNTSMQMLMSKHTSALKRACANFDTARTLGASINDLIPGSVDRINGIRNTTESQSELVTIGELHFYQSLTAILDENGQFLGAVMELEDLTNEVAIEREVDLIIANAAQGDFSAQINTSDKDGFYLRISSGLNELVNNINSALSAMNQVLSAVAEGDLTKTIDQNFAGEFGVLRNSVNSTVERLRDILSEVKQSAADIRQSTTEISSNISQLNHRTEAQAASLEETSAAMDEMNTTVKETESRVQAAHENAKNSANIAVRGNESMLKIVSAMDEINSSSTAISNIIGAIDEIAFQTNLLALNAAVEAARAGEQGRGFAVVAGEVRTLAQRSATAAKEIKSLISESRGKVESGTVLVHESGETLKTIVEEFTKVGETMAEVMRGAESQSTGISEVAQSIVAMDQGTQQNASMAEECATASANMADQAQRLDQLISFFRS
jgi:methyl-accepting chemotaxis protein